MGYRKSILDRILDVCFFGVLPLVVIFFIIGFVYLTYHEIVYTNYPYHNFYLIKADYRNMVIQDSKNGKVMSLYVTPPEPLQNNSHYGAAVELEMLVHCKGTDEPTDYFNRCDLVYLKSLFGILR